MTAGRAIHPAGGRICEVPRPVEAGPPPAVRSPTGGSVLSAWRVVFVYQTRVRATPDASAVIGPAG
jgi:hypothetical protein